MLLPKVSVLLPTYNYAHYIGEAIDSVLLQTYAHFELIIVDDCSKDNTDAVVQQYLSDKRVSYYKNPVNLGLGGNFNKCLEYASGKYIKYLLADDKLHPQLLEEFVTIMEQYPTVSLVTSYSELFGIKNYIREQPFQGLQNGKKMITESLKQGRGNFIGEPTGVMLRKENVAANQFNTDYTCYIDWEMWIRQLTLGDCYILPKPLFSFRVHEKQASKAVLSNFKFTFEEYTFYKSVTQQYSHSISANDAKEIDAALQKRAMYCAEVMYKVAGRLHTKQGRNLFAKAFAIAYHENLLAPMVGSMFRKITGKISGRAEKKYKTPALDK